MKNELSLIDTETAARIRSQLAPVKVDTWAPTRRYVGGHLESFYRDTIKPNILAIIFIVVVLVFVIYRYRQMAVQKKIEKLVGKEEKKWKPDRKTMEVIQEEIERIQATEEAAAVEREIKREIKREKKKREKV